MTRKAINTSDAPAPVGPYSQGIDSFGLVFCSGQIPIDPATGTMVERNPVEEAGMIIGNLEKVLKAGGSGLDRILRLDVFLTDMGIFPEINSYLSTVFPVDPPARVTVEVSALPMGARIEMAAIAIK